jgi:hypothetical protein
MATHALSCDLVQRSQYALDILCHFSVTQSDHELPSIQVHRMTQPPHSRWHERMTRLKTINPMLMTDP